LATGDVASTGQDQPQLPIGESDGAFSTAYPIDVPSFHGIEPHLALRYTSSEEIGQLGVGWTIDGLSQIERSSPHFGSPLYGNSDVWRLDGTELVHCTSGMAAASCSGYGTFTTRVESYRKIFRDNSANSWTVTDPDGTQYLYLPVANWTADKTSVIATQYRYLLSTVTDPHGNSVAYDYTCNGPPNCYIYSIIYNGTAIRFYWESRPDTVTYATGQVLGQWIWRLHSIDVRVSGSRRRAYAISYTAPGLSSGSGRSLLASIQEYGTDATMDSDGTISGGTALPPAKYLYQTASFAPSRADWSDSVPKLVQGDFNGDGRQDLAWVSGCTVNLRLSNGSAFTAASWAIQACSGSVGDADNPHDYEVGDFNGDGRPDIAVFYGNGLTRSNDKWSVPVLINTGSGFYEYTQWSNLNGSGVNDGLEFRVGDFNGDGLDDFLVQSKVSATPNPADSCFAVYLSTGSKFYADSHWQATDGCRKRGEVLDINGDGKSDIISFSTYQYNSSTLTGSTDYLVLRSNGTGFDELVGTVQIPCDFSGCGGSWRPSDPTWLRADVNGDGKTDLVAVYGQQWTDTDGVVWPPEVAHIMPLLSTGSGFVAEPVLANKGRFDAAAGSWVVADLNGDGREDLAVAEPGGTWSDAQHGPQIEAYLSTGTGFNWTYWGSTGWAQGDASAQLFHITASSTPYVGDFSGDGKHDIAWREVDSSGSEASWQPIAVFDSPSAVLDLMTRATASLGAVTTIGYTPSSTWANSSNLPSVLQTATSLAINDGRGHVSTTTVSYGGGLWDKSERRFLGFGSTTVTLPCNSGEDACPTRITDYLQSRAGNPAVRTRVFSGTGTLLYDRQDTYTHDEGSLPYAALDTDTKVTYDSSGNVAEVQRSFDDFGNLTQLTQLGDNTVAGDEVTTVTTYYPNRADYLVNYPTLIDVHAGAGASGTLLARSAFTYDGAAASNTQPVKGDVTRVQNWLPSGMVASTAEYDGYGNKTAATDPLGNRSEWVYDSTYHLYVTSVHDPLYSSDSRHKTVTVWDGICGVPTQTRDMNSQQTTYSYDVLCRPTYVAYPDGGFKSTTYVDIGSPTTQYIETDTPAADGTGNLWQRAYFDGLERTYQDRRKGPSATQDILVDTNFSLRNGTIAVKSLPRYADQPRRNLTYTYDALDRPVQLTYPDTNKVLKAYGAAYTFSDVTVTDELGRVTTTHYDAYGRAVRLDRHLDGATVSTYNTYDLLGHLTGIRDTAGNEWSYSYDSLGRKTAADDPDLGQWSYRYDNADQLTQVTDALGQLTAYTYDAAGRRLTKTTRSGTAQAATTSYTYDEHDWGFNVGHLTHVRNENALYAYNYDSVGRTIDKALMVDGACYTVLPAFDTGGRVRWTEYKIGCSATPSFDFFLGASTNQWSYDSAGRLYAIPGVQASETYTADGQTASVTRANGVTTTSVYHPNRLWLLSATTRDASNTVLQNLAFSRDARGRILSSTSNVSAESWSYEYDDFDRLTQATNAGDSSLSQSFVYNIINNMIRNSAVGSYSYSSAHQPRPHAVYKAGNTTYGYDDNGNMVTAGGTTLAYDGENRLVQDGATSFAYAPDGSRLKKIGSTTTLYIGDDWEVSGGVSTFYLPGDAVMTNGVITWLGRDQIGSVRLTTDANGAVVQRAHYKPFGERLETIASQMTSKGFIGQRNDDETGLVYLHARYYDPRLAKFITADPSDPTDPGVGLNRYAYAGNSPIINLDPSGLSGNDFGGKGVNRDGPGITGGDHARDGGGGAHDSGDSRDDRNTDTTNNPVGPQYAHTSFYHGLSITTISGVITSVNGILIDKIIRTIAEANSTSQASVQTCQFAEFPEPAAPVEPIPATPETPPAPVQQVEPELSASSQTNAVNLAKQLSSQQTLDQVLSGQGKPIIGAGTLKALTAANALAAEYGGLPSDWAKISSAPFGDFDTQFTDLGYEIHAYKNQQTGETVEPKTVRTKPGPWH
jgi:RHS repeat-associated protein